jgi:hypothetical protein
MSELTIVLAPNMFSYVSNEELLDTIEDITDHVIQSAVEYEQVKLDSLVHFCNTGSFLTEEE